MNSITFKAALPSDFDYFYNLRHQTMAEHNNRVEEPWDHEEEVQKHKNYVREGVVRLIYHNGSRVGCISVIPHQNGLRLGLFCIEPQHQRKGLGEQVVRTVIEEAAEQKKDLFLDVLIDNPACALYERLGFERIDGDCPILVYYKRSYDDGD